MPAGPSGPGGGGREIPHSLDAERGVLGSALASRGQVLDLCVERPLVPDSFVDRRHRLLYETLIGLQNENAQIDQISVATRLRDQGRLDDVGGLDFLTALVDAVPTLAHAAHYIDLVYDKHVLRRVIGAAQTAADLAFQAEEESAEILAKAEQAMFEISSDHVTAVQPFETVMAEMVGHINRMADTGKGSSGIPTGFPDLDGKLLGFHPGDLVILAARPSMGKTSLALNIALNIATGRVQGAPTGPIQEEHARPVLVFSLEMTNDQLAMRMLCCEAHVSMQTVRSGQIRGVHAQLLDAADRIRAAGLYLDDRAGRSVLELRAVARQLARRHRIGFVVVDYLQLLHYPGAGRDGRQQEVAQISGALKAMAKELKVPVLVLSQLSRAPEQRSGTPRLSDLRDSGAIEQDADVVLLLRRPSRIPEDPEHDDDTLAVLDVAKNRNGPTGTIRLNFIDHLTLFQNRTERYAEEEYH